MESRSANAGTKRADPLKGKGGLVMIAVVVVIWAIAWWAQRYGRPVEPGANPQVANFVHLSQPDAVDRVVVRGIPQPYSLMKMGLDWRLLTPLSARAAKQTVDDAVKGLLDASVTSYVADRVPTSRLGEYGLDHPVCEILLTDGGRHLLQIGTTQKQGGYYARDTHDERVFVVSTFAVDAFKNKKPEDFRDKSAMALDDTDKVTRVEIDGPKGRVEVDKRGADWALVRPSAAPADTTEVSSLLSEAKGLQAASFISGGARDGARYGLDHPRLTFTATDDRGAHTLLLGGQTQGKTPQIYALRVREPDAMLVDRSAFDNLNKGPIDLHSRTLLGFDTAKASRASVQGPNGAFTIEKRGSDWWLVRPTVIRADQGKAQSLLSALAGSALHFVEERPADLKKYALDPPAVQATVDVAGEPQMRYMLGSAAPGTEKGYYVRTSKSVGVYEVSDFDYQSINVKPDDMKQK